MKVSLRTLLNAAESIPWPLNIDRNGSVRKGMSFACVNHHPASLRQASSSCEAPSVICLAVVLFGCGAVIDVSPVWQLSGSIALISLLSMHCLSIAWCLFHMLFFVVFSCSACAAID